MNQKEHIEGAVMLFEKVRELAAAKNAKAPIILQQMRERWQTGELVFRDERGNICVMKI